MDRFRCVPGVSMVRARFMMDSFRLVSGVTVDRARFMVGPLPLPDER